MTEKLFNNSNSRLFLLIIVYITYIFFGASIFDAVESPHEARIVRDLNNYVREFRNQHQCLTNEDLKKFIQVISIASNKGISPLRNVSGDQKWTFGQSVFFSGTVLTTIGYGNVSPQTKGGKLFCIIFAIIGIPITLILLTALIERLMNLTRRFLQFITEKLQPCIETSFRKTISISEIRITFAFVCVLFVMVFLMLIPAAIYSSIEGWSYVNSFYYCFISVSTVGLGDYVPGDQADQEHRHLYKLCSTAYLIIGVLIMVWLLEIFSEIPEFNFYHYFTLTKDGQLTHHATRASNPSASYIHTISGNTNENETIGIDLRPANNRATYESTLKHSSGQEEVNIE
jgi:potassium channel subfamily K protein 1